MKYIVITAAVFMIIQSCDYKKPDVVFETNSPVKLKKDLLVLRDLFENVHAGSFAYNNKADVYRLFDSIASSITMPLTKREFLDKVDFIIDNIHCAHTDCYFPQEYYDTLLARKYFFPLPLIKIGSKIYVNTDAYNIPYGSEVLLINNHAVKEVFNKLLYHKHTDGYGMTNKDAAINADFAYDYFLAFGPSAAFELKYRDVETKEVETINVHAATLDNIYSIASKDIAYDFPTDIPYDLSIQNDKKTAVLTIRTFDLSSYSQRNAYSNFLENSFSLLRLEGVKNLIIDYRNNTGGYFRCSYELLGYFISSPLLQFDSAIKRFNRLPFKDYVSKSDSSTEMQIDTAYAEYSAISGHRYTLKRQQFDTCFPAHNLYKGKLFIIINGNVISAAASSVALLKERAGAVVVGEEAGGGYTAFNSDLISYTLPNTGIKVNIPTLRYYPPVTKKENLNAVKPDYYVPLTKPDLTELNDGPLQFILDSLIR